MKIMRSPEDVCVEYAVTSNVAAECQSVLIRCKCEFAIKPHSPVYTSDFVCVDPGEDGRLACTLMSEEELAEEERGGGEGTVCDNCRIHRLPALKDLREAKRRLAKIRREIVKVGNRLTEVL